MRDRKRGGEGPKFSLNIPQRPYSGLLKEVFFRPFLLPYFFLLSPSLYFEPCLALCSVQLMFLTQMTGRHLGCWREYLREGEDISIHCIFSQHCNDTDCLSNSAPSILFSSLHPFRFSRFEPSLSCSSSDFPTWLQATPGCKWRFVTHMISWNSTLFYW